MYDMYPEWGPSRHADASTLASTTAGGSALQTALDLRDNGGERPDDN